MANASTHPWPQERLDVLRKAWDAGTTSGAIADMLGVTRNAVLGKLKRLDLLGEGRPRKPETAPKVASLASRPVKPPQAKPTPVAEALPFIVLPVRPVAPVSGALVGIMALRDRHCRWPFACDDGETRYCGKHVMRGSWCAEHRARAFAGKVGGTDEAEAA